MQRGASLRQRLQFWLARRDWEKFGRHDPLWAVLNEPDKLGNRWDVDAFFRTGSAEIASVIAQVRQICPGLSQRRALDFGCGVGRATQALADHFSHVVGVDVSQHMLDHAQRYNRHGASVEYVHNARPDLSCFPSASFDFVHSVITLQHIAPDHAHVYLAEFMRLLAPGGAAYFQVPYAVLAGDPPERLVFSTWPPTLLKRLVRVCFYHWRVNVIPLLVRRPPMAMHAISPDRVREIVTLSGGVILETMPHNGSGPTCPSYAYLVRKS